MAMWKLRQREAAEASAMLGLTVRDNLGLPDRRLSVIAQQIDLMVAAIRKLSSAARLRSLFR